MEAKINIDTLELVKEIINALSPLLTKGQGEDKIMGVQELADYLGVNRDTIYKKVGLYEIPFFKIGDLTKFKKSQIDQWIESQTRKPIPSKKP
jgi:excisionase family DNA binding protein